MKRFKFRLQRILDLRVAHEQSLQSELAVYLHRCQTEEERLSGLIQQLRYAKLDLIRLQSVGAQGIELQECAVYIAALEEQVARQRAVVSNAHAAVEAKRAELVEASRERKALDRLREVKQERHRAEETRREQAAANEVAAARFTRGRIGLSPST